MPCDRTAPRGGGQASGNGVVSRHALLADAHTLAVLLQIVDFTWFRMETVLHEHMTIGIAFVGVPFALELPQGREMLAKSRTS